MDDSNILYYLVLGAIYIISRVLKRKKPQQQASEPDLVENMEEPVSTPKRRSPVEDLLRELSKEMGQEEVHEKPVKPVLQPVSEPVIQPTPEKKSMDRPVERSVSVEIEREKPVFEKSEKFVEDEEENATKDKIYELLSDADGVRSAIVMQEIFQRKY